MKSSDAASEIVSTGLDGLHVPAGMHQMRHELENAHADHDEDGQGNDYTHNSSFNCPTQQDSLSNDSVSCQTMTSKPPMAWSAAALPTRSGSWGNW